MLSTEKNMPWWLVVVTGVLIIAAGIFLLVSDGVGLDVLAFLVGLGVLVFGVYYLFKAVNNKKDNSIFVPYLIHGLLNIILLLLIIFIRNSPALLGVILASWLVIFGFFGIVQARKQSDNKTRIRLCVLLLLCGVVLMILPFVLGMGHVIFLGIVGIVIGVVRTAMGIIYKVRLDQRTTGGRSNVM